MDDGPPDYWKGFANMGQLTNSHAIRTVSAYSICCGDASDEKSSVNINQPADFVAINTKYWGADEGLVDLVSQFKPTQKLM